jgi:hypothetical protein
VLWIALPILWSALGGWRQPLVLSDAAGDVALRDRTIAFLTARLQAPHVEPTDRLRYWLAYASYRQGLSIAVRMPTATTRDESLRLGLLAFQHRQRATLLTHQFGLGDRREWIDEARALGAPWEFISPYLAALEPNAALGDAAWRERIWLARIDPSSALELEAQFSRERPDGDLNAMWVGALDEGVALPEGTVTTLDGTGLVFRRTAVDGWTAILVWSVECMACEADLARFDALAREYVGRVLLLATDADTERVRLSLADRGVTLPTVVAPPEVVGHLSAAPGARLLVSPDRVFVPLRGDNWETDLRRAFSLAGR